MRRLVLALLLALSGGSCIAQNLHALSPDGEIVAYADDDALMLVDLRSGHPTTPVRIATVPTFSAVPRWSPDGDRLAFYSNQSGTMQLWVFELRTRKVRQLSSVKDGISPNPLGSLGGWANDPLRFSWSPDGSSIVFSSDVTVEEPSARTAPQFPTSDEVRSGIPITLNRDTPPEWTLHGVVSYGHQLNRSFNDTSLNVRDVPTLKPARRTQLFRLDIARRKVTPITSDGAGYFTPEWAPQDNRIAYTSVEGRTLMGGTTPSNIYVLDVTSGTRKRLTDDATQKITPRWSPDGRSIAYYGLDLSGTFARKDEGVYIVPGDGSAPPRRVSPTNDRHIMAYEWSPDGSALYVSYWDGLSKPLIRVDVRKGDWEFVAPPDAAIDGIASSAGGVVWTQLNEPNAATDLWAWSSKSGARRIATLAPAADLRNVRRYEVVHWQNSKAETIDGILVYPLAYEPGKVYPLVVDTYSSVTIERRYYDEVNYVKVTPDYFILRPNHRAPHMWLNPLKSAVYTAAAVGPNGISVMTDDIMTGVDRLIDSGKIRGDRMAIAGFSNGGLQGLQLLTHTNRFRCAVIQSPSTADWLTSFFLSTDDSETIRWMYGIAPWQQPSLYTALIPLYHADKIVTPILMAVGDREAAVLPTIEMYNVLRYLKRDVTLLRYPNEGHGFSGAAEDDFRQRIASYLSSCLQ